MRAYSNNGLSFRGWDDEGTKADGEVFFDHVPTAAELAAALVAASGTGLTSSTDSKWMLLGFGSGADSTGYPAQGAFFLCDPANIYSGAGLAGAATNHWVCVTRDGAGAAYADSGLSYSVSSITPDRLMVILSASAASFYADGTLVATLTTHIPTAAVYSEMQIGTGGAASPNTTSKTMYISAPVEIHIYAAGRTLP